MMTIKTYNIKGKRTVSFVRTGEIISLRMISYCCRALTMTHGYSSAFVCHKNLYFFLFVPKIDRSPGSCNIEGKTYLSETTVPRDHPCHYCICYGGKIDCFWKQCAHIPDGCQVMAFQDTCNPSLYICGIKLIQLSFLIYPSN